LSGSAEVMSLVWKSRTDCKGFSWSHVM